MISITLNLINNSNNASPGVVIFQQNLAESSTGFAVAWIVLSNAGTGIANPFRIPMDMTVAASDSYGNITPQLPAPNGSRFEMVSSMRGNQLQLSQQPASAPQIMEVYNELPVGTIGVNAYKNGLLIAQKTSVGPGQKAAFAFDPTIYITLNSDVQQGELINAAALSDNIFQLSLIGIKSADIVMTGGGPGTDAQPILFTLQNVEMA
ncbi:MAG: hypothetical protein ABIQ40_12605 [Bacteroidia bacterium]